MSKKTGMVERNNDGGDYCDNNRVDDTDNFYRNVEQKQPAYSVTPGLPVCGRKGD